MADELMIKTKDFTEKFNTPVQQQKDYYPTWAEFAAQKFTQIIRSGQQSGSGDTEIYEVPAGTILFLTTINHSHSLQAQLNGFGTGVSYFYFEATGTGTRNILSTSIICQNGLITNQSIPNNVTSLAYPMPIKIPAGTKIFIDASALSIAIGTFTGFLVPFVD